MQSGMIHSNDDTLLVQPLPTHLAKHFVKKKGEIPHLFSRTSLKRGSPFEGTAYSNRAGEWGGGSPFIMVREGAAYND